METHSPIINLYVVSGCITVVCAPVSAKFPFSSSVSYSKNVQCGN